MTRLAQTLALSVCFASSLAAADSTKPSPPEAAKPTDPERSAPPIADKPELSVHGSTTEALSAILDRAKQDAGKQPHLVAFGEYHQLKGKTHIRSALKRFAEELWPSMQPGASDLVLETFVPEGNCGKEETKVVKDVDKTIKRPETTENELVTLIKQAKAQGVQPHILQVSCKDYESVLDEKAQVDYVKMLKLINDLLEKRIAEVRNRRIKAGVDKTVMVYGGALHNDLYPQQELAPYTFGQSLTQSFPGEYLEVDLYVPEFIEADKSIRSQPWYPLYKKAQKPGQIIVVRRGAGSFILLFSPTQSAQK